MEQKKVFEILNTIKKKKQKLFLWTFKYNELVQLDTWISELNPQDFKIGFVNGRFKVAEAIIGSRENIMLYCPDLKVAFSSKIKKVLNGEVFLKFPNFSEMIDERGNDRLQLDIRFQMKLKGKDYNFKTFDIGYNGISIIVKESQKTFFNVSETVDECYLHVADKKIKLPVHIRNIVKMSAYEYRDIPYTFYRVGMQFNDVEDKKKNFIRRIIDSKKNVG